MEKLIVEKTEPIEYPIEFVISLEKKSEFVISNGDVNTFHTQLYDSCKHMFNPNKFSPPSNFKLNAIHRLKHY